MPSVKSPTREVLSRLALEVPEARQTRIERDQPRRDPQRPAAPNRRQRPQRTPAADRLGDRHSRHQIAPTSGQDKAQVVHLGFAPRLDSNQEPSG
ncbi:predicted protein [Streptomyces sp. AA4]|nr:predicted protein [Streptomyces sp. AA4]